MHIPYMNGIIIHLNGKEFIFFRKKISLVEIEKD